MARSLEGVIWRLYRGHHLGMRVGSGKEVAGLWGASHNPRYWGTITSGHRGGYLGYREELSVGFYQHSLPNSTTPHICPRFRISEPCMELS